MTKERIEYSDLKPDDFVLLKMNNKYAEFQVIDIMLPLIKWKLVSNDQVVWDSVPDLKDRKVKLEGRIIY